MLQHDKSIHKEGLKLKHITTSQLENMLRLDAKQGQNSSLCTEDIFSIMDELENRKKDESVTDKSITEAFEIFNSHYYPLSKGEADSSTHQKYSSVKKESDMLPQWLQRVAASAAILVILLVSIISTNALGNNLWRKIAKWTNNVFRFDTVQVPVTEVPESYCCDEFTSLNDALVFQGIPVNIVPTWVPNGYKLECVHLLHSPLWTGVSAQYKSENHDLIIQIKSNKSHSSQIIEKNDSPTKTIRSNGTTYYVFNNSDLTIIAWIADHYECYVSGKLTEQEIKAMIDSVGAKE